ncbi:MAG: hypothetical protein R3B48_17055 [Kofleriaceae bacterium]
MSSRLFVSLSLAAGLALAALASACTSATEVEPAGQLAIPLTSTGGDGLLYRLSSATFEISGPSGLVLLDASADVPSVAAELPPGLTTVLLRPGWSLTRSADGGATFEPVSALLGSANPATLRVLADTASTISFEFFVRNPNGMLTVRFGVDPAPRQLAGSVTITAGTGDLAGYAGKRLDFSIYYGLAQLTRILQPDGTKTLSYETGPVATEFYNDGLGVLENVVGPSMAGGFLQFQISAKPDGTQEFFGQYFGASEPFPNLDLGPQILDLPVSLDASGFPNDEFFVNLVSFNLAYLTATGGSTATGRFVLRNLLH